MRLNGLLWLRITFHDTQEVGSGLDRAPCLMLLVEKEHNPHVLNDSPCEEEGFFQKFIHNVQIDGVR